jgi:proline iminopeptidase
LSLDQPFASSYRRELFPPIEPYAEGWLAVGDGHTLYWYECGNPKGRPALFLHGGPGAGCISAYRRFFDPEIWRVVLVDQRGAGRSRPAADVTANTTQHLVEDLEKLREARGIEDWLVFGGSWGSTLALAYGETYPERCTGFVLRGVFLGTQAEIDWFMHGMGHFFPEAAEAFVAPIPPGERDDLLEAYYRRLADPDPEVHLPAARAWTLYESRCSSLRSRIGDGRLTSDRFALAVARMEAHYFRHQCFLAPDKLLANAGRVAHLPCVIVQGRYDIVCPPVSARRLAAAWRRAELVMIEDAGHSALEPGIRAALVRATEEMARPAVPVPTQL